uniref:Pol-like protein n=1 Tax=Phallusia mammillata TaxID=59560 RepID=A0A6F9DNI7_9ASCI|nr:pol-like protein [Phallusia mammillata]
MYFTVASFNVSGIRDPIKRKSIFKFIREKKFQIVLIQETHCSDRDEKLWQLEWGGEVVWSHGTNRSKGVAILFSRNLSYLKTDLMADPDGRFLIVNLTIADKKLTLANVYGPNKDDPDFFNKFFADVITFGDGDIVLGGDFNIILNENLDKSPGAPHANRHSRATVQAHMNALDLNDAFRLLHSTIKKYSRIQSNPLVATRLDFFLVSKSILSNVPNADIVPGIMSDHKIVVLTLEFAPNARGRGYWKLNTRLLNDKRYVKLIRKTIDDYTQTNPANHVNPHTRWDALKAVIRGVSIGFSARVKKENTSRQNELELGIKAFEDELVRANTPADQKLVTELTQLKNDLDNLIENKTKGAIIRSRALWAEKGEKNTKYFLNLEKRHVGKKSINKLKAGDRIYTNQKSILEELAKFYENLYEKRDSNYSYSQVTQHLVDLNLPKLKSTQIETCDMPITQEELCGVIHKMPRNKSPGLDGLPVEFYQTFWPDLKTLFTDAWSYTEKNCKFSPSQTQGVVTLIPKPRKDPLITTNYRPISLLNTDYKIISKTINNRIKAYLDILVSED